MPQDYSSINTFPCPKTFSANGTANYATKIILPSTCKRVVIGCQGGALWWDATGTEGADLATSKTFIPAANKEEIRLGTGKQRVDALYIAGQAGSELVSVVLYET